MIASPVLDAAPAAPDGAVIYPITNRILVAEDHLVSRLLLVQILESWGFDVVTAEDGEEALGVLESEDAPPLAIIDWAMPKLDGLKVCARVRERTGQPYTYLLLLSARNKKEDLAFGLESGADDYVTKPYDTDELRARLKVGQRVVSLERALQHQVNELEEALSHVKQLQGLVPICIYCKNVRDDQDYWHQLEEYIHAMIGTDFSHGVCPRCYANFMRDLGLPETGEP